MIKRQMINPLNFCFDLTNKQLYSKATRQQLLQLHLICIKYGMKR